MQSTQTKIKGWAKNLPFWMAAVLSIFIFLAGSTGIQAGCIDLADEPLAVQSMGAPGMIMFMYDNSGSMEFTVMTNETEGSFHTPTVPYPANYYGYCFLYDPDYGANDLPTIQGSGDEMYWKSQWAGYNKIYYNPDVLYEPWPAWTTIPDVKTIPACAPQADPDNPLTDVVKSSTTFNLSATWKTLSVGGGGDLDDLINTQGIIVDNTDTLTVQEIVVDDEGDGVDDPGFSVTGNLGDWNKFAGNWNYYDGDYMNYYGDRDPLPVKATWTFNVATAGNYEVLASVSKYSTRTSKAKYTITHQGVDTVKTISQRINGGPTQDWVSLGAYDFSAGAGAGKVVLNFTTAKSGASISVDVIRLVPTFTTGTSDRYFTSTGPWGIATSSYDYGANYLWTPQINEEYTATWTAENLDPNSKYNAYARWVANVYRSDAVEYTVDGTTVPMNQQLNSGKWMLLKDNVDFFKDIGVVKLDHYCNSTDWDRACADAVAFLPSSLLGSGTSLNIVMAHYFVKGSDNNLYLVNLDGAIKYYLVTDDGDEKVEDGELSEVTLAEATAAGIVTGRTYAEERQNFANWFQFDRSRDKVAHYALGTLVTSMGNIYFGLTTIPSRDIYSLRAVKETTVLNRDDTLEVLNNIYNLPTPNGGTPLKDGFLKVGDYFTGGASLVNNADKQYFFAGGFSDADSFPYLNRANGGNCQQAFMIAMTDGMYNSNQGQNVGNLDNDDSSVWDGGEYGDSYSNTLADIAMDFYERDLKADTILTNDVPTNEWDQNNQQHAVTYALSFGVHGSIDPESDDWKDCPSATGVGQSCGTWPKPVKNTLTTIDDLYHATVNGRGMFLNAGNPQELVDALMRIKANIEARLGTAAAVTTNSVQRQIGSKLYRGQYSTGKWSGNLDAFEVDANTGDIIDQNPATDVIDPIWSAKDLLDEVTYTNRKIYSFNGTAGIPFEYSSMTEGQKTRLANGLAYAFGSSAAYAFGTIDATDVENLVNYLRGDNSHDQSNGGPFRTRAHKLGDIVHSEAEYNNDVLYVGANDGMLHAFHSETGVEQGAYVPNMLYDELPKLASPNYEHQYYMDNSPYAKNIGDRTLLVEPMGKGAKGLFMLDVSTPMGEAEATKVGLWEYPGVGVTDPDLGYTYSQAAIAKTKAAGWVAITGNGYESDNGHAILYVLDAVTGTVVQKLDTGVGGCNGLSSPAVIDPDMDGNIDFVYAGDLKGNMWKFDLRGTQSSNWKVAYSGAPLFTATSPTGGQQPITNRPGVMLMSSCSPKTYGYLVLFGTGRYLGITDLADQSVQTVYGVYDWGPDWEAKTGPGGDSNKALGALSIGSPRMLPTASAAAGVDLTLVQQTITDGTGGYRFITNNDVTYFNVQTGSGSDLGWYVNLPNAGERSVRRPIIQNKVFMFISIIPEESPCSSGGTSYLYEINACSGGWPEEPQFDINDDAVFDENDLIDGQPPIGKGYGGIVNDLTVLSGAHGEPGKAYPTDDKGNINPEPTNSAPPGAYFWHVIE